MLKKRIFLVVNLLLFTGVLMAQSDSASANNSSDTLTFGDKANMFNSKMEVLIQYIPVPVFSYSEETGMLFGITKFNDFNIGDTLPSSVGKTQPSMVSALVYYTQKKQFKINVETDLMFHQNKQNLKARATYLNFPLLFFGVGNDTKIEDGVSVLYEDVQFAGSFSQRIHKNIYAGPSYKYLNSLRVEYTDSTDDSPIIDSVDISENIGLTSGLGAVFTYEGRDNRLNAFKGSYVKIEVEFFEKWVGSDFEYIRMFIDMRKYVPLLKNNKLILAGQILGEFVTDGANIQGLPNIGGPDWGSRGIYYGRFRDESSLAGNLELRFPLFWIFGGTVFGGVGQVQPTLANFTWSGNHYILGGGLRLMVSSKNRVNLRFDFGISKDDTAFIIAFGEAF